MSAEAFPALAISGEYGGVGFRLLGLQPGEQRGAKIEADARVIVGDEADVAFAIQNAGRGVGGVALSRDALVPIVVRSGGILEFDDLEPGILAGRLVKVRVNAEITFFHRVAWMRRTAAVIADAGFRAESLVRLPVS